MPITLLVRSGEEGADVAPLKLTFDAPRLVIGRGSSCDVRLPDPSVSHRHASIHAKGPEYTLVDEGSTNGTFVGGVKVAPHTSRLLRTGDLVRAGRVWLEIRIDQTPATRDLPNATRDLALALVSRAMRSIGDDVVPKVHVVEGRDLGAEMPLEEEGRVYLIGRGAHCDLPLADQDASREHLQIVRRGSAVLVRDLGAKNGVSIGDQRIQVGRDIPWRPAFVLRAANTVLALHEPVISALAHLEDAADEMLSQEEASPPPPMSSEHSPSAASVPAPVSPDSFVGPAAPIAKLQSGVTPASPRRKQGWSFADILVMLVALSILGLSIAGLVWLLRG